MIPQYLLQALFPSTCAACQRVLTYGERQLCLHCLSSLDQTLYSPLVNNPVETLLRGRLYLEAATSIYHFRQGNTVQHVVHAMKFHSCPEVAELMGRQLGLALLSSQRFDSVDMLLPVPLHWIRRMQRGYNQSELLCRGIAEVMPRPIVTKCLVRHRYTRPQSRRAGAERRYNVEQAFRVRHPELLEGRHVLLVDDVLTTGATIAACGETLAAIPGLRLSVATLAVAE